MKLAEALTLRADAQKRVEQLMARATGAARYQEGEPPQEDPRELLSRARASVDEVESWVRRINRTNATTQMSPGVTLTDMLARRDALLSHRKIVVDLADAAAGKGSYRSIRSELRYLTQVPIRELRDEADRLAREFRELDTRIQQANWTVDLVD